MRQFGTQYAPAAKYNAAATTIKGTQEVGRHAYWQHNAPQQLAVREEMDVCRGSLGTAQDPASLSDLTSFPPVSAAFPLLFGVKKVTRAPTYAQKRV